MPGFVKTPKDEARWAKAKEAASKETEHGSESFWKLSNYIYHKMGKTEEDQKMAELYKSEITNSFQSGKELNTENLRHFLMNDRSAQQSIVSNEVEQMSDEKKYTAKEAAIAVLKKAEEMLKASELMKADILHGNVAQRRQSRAAGYKQHGDMVNHKIAIDGAKEAHKEQLSALKQQPKPNLTKDENMTPKGEIHPKEPQAGESEQPGARVKQDAPPAPTDVNPKVNGNPEWGTTPGTVKGHFKLAKFCGHVQAKRKAKTPPPQGAM